MIICRSWVLIMCARTVWVVEPIWWASSAGLQTHTEPSSNPSTSTFSVSLVMKILCSSHVISNSWNLAQSENTLKESLKNYPWGYDNDKENIFWKLTPVNSCKNQIILSAVFYRFHFTDLFYVSKIFRACFRNRKVYYLNE